METSPCPPIRPLSEEEEASDLPEPPPEVIMSSRLRDLLGPDFKMRVNFIRKIEACGLETYRCAFCFHFSLEVEEMSDHLRRHHLSLKKKMYSVGHMTGGDAGRNVTVHRNRRFPTWSGTMCTDATMRRWLFESGQDCHTNGCIRSVTLDVNCQGLDRRRFHCGICGHETEADMELQKDHLLAQHISLSQYTIRSRYFCCF
jgi:hypothetical protein